MAMQQTPMAQVSVAYASLVAEQLGETARAVAIPESLEP